MTRTTLLIAAISLSGILVTAVPATAQVVDDTGELIYFKVTGAVPDITGTSTFSLWPDSFTALAFEQEVRTASGPGSQTEISAVTLLRHADLETPAFLEHAVAGTTAIPSVEIRFYDNYASPPVHLYTMLLTNVTVLGVKHMRLSELEPAFAATPMLEELTLSFESATWTFDNGSESNTFTHTVGSKSASSNQ